MLNECESQMELGPKFKTSHSGPAAPPLVGGGGPCRSIMSCMHICIHNTIQLNAKFIIYFDF